MSVKDSHWLILSVEPQVYGYMVIEIRNLGMKRCWCFTRHQHAAACCLTFKAPVFLPHLGVWPSEGPEVICCGLNADLDKP